MTSTNVGEYNIKLNGNQSNDQKMSNEAGDTKNNKRKDNTTAEVQPGESSLPRRRPGPRSRLRSIPTPSSPSKSNDKASTEVRNSTSNAEGETTKVAITTPAPALQHEKGTRQGLRSKNPTVASTSGKNEEKNDAKSLPTLEEAEKGKKTDEVLNGESKKSDNTETEPVHPTAITDENEGRNVAVLNSVAENNFDLNTIQDSQAQKNEEHSELSEDRAIAPRAPLDASVTRDASQPVEHYLTNAFSEGAGISDTLTSSSVYGLSPRSSINTHNVFYAGVSAESPLFPVELGTKRKAPIHSFEEMTDEYIPPKRQAAPKSQPVRNSSLWRLVTNNPVRYLFVSNDTPGVDTENVENEEDEPTSSEPIVNEPGIVKDEGIVEDANNSDTGTSETEVNVEEEEDRGGNRRRRFCSVM